MTSHAFTVPANQLLLRVALFDEHTDGQDDLDLLLVLLPEQPVLADREERRRDVGRADRYPAAARTGSYVLLVHGFETDQVAGGPGANYSLFTWSFGLNDVAGNLTVTAPTTVANGDRVDFQLQWSGLDPGSRYLGAISHTTPSGLYDATIVNVVTP